MLSTPAFASRSLRAVRHFLINPAAVSPLVAWIYYQPKYDSATYKAPEQVVLYFNAYRRQYVQVRKRATSLSDIRIITVARVLPTHCPLSLDFDDFVGDGTSQTTQNPS